MRTRHPFFVLSIAGFALVFLFFVAGAGLWAFVPHGTFPNLEVSRFTFTVYDGGIVVSYANRERLTLDLFYASAAVGALPLICFVRLAIRQRRNRRRGFPVVMDQRDG